MFANAGFGATRGFLEESPEHWRSMVLTNVYGAVVDREFERGLGEAALVGGIERAIGSEARPRGGVAGAVM